MNVKILDVGVPNKNGRTYSKEAAEDMVKQATTRIEQGTLFGELSPSVSSTIDMQRVSHQITDVRLEGGAVYATVRVLKTPMGNIVKELLDNGVQVDFRSRGFANISEDGVVSDYQLVSIDVVKDGA